MYTFGEGGEGITHIYAEAQLCPHVILTFSHPSRDWAMPNIHLTLSRHGSKLEEAGWLHVARECRVICPRESQVSVWGTPSLLLGWQNWTAQE